MGDKAKYLTNPTAGYRRSMFAEATGLLYASTGEPWFTWGDVPLMKQHPAIRFGLKLLRTPFASIKLNEEKVKVPRKPQAAAFLADCFKRFWVRGVPRVLDSWHCWGRGVSGLDFRYDTHRKILRIKKVRNLEPFDVDPQEYLKGSKKGEFAGVKLRSGIYDRGSEYVTPRHVFYFSGFQALGKYCDVPRIAGAVGPWKEQTMPAGANASRRLFYWTRAVGVTVVRYPHGERLVDPSGNYVDAQDAARFTGERIMNGVVVAMPNDKHPTVEGKYKWEIEQRPGQSDTAGILEYCKSLNTDMWLGMEIPEEIIQKDSGAYSGRALPMESWLGGADEVAGMLWDEFREQHLERLMWENYRVREFDAPITSLLEDFRQQSKKGGEAGGPSDSPPTDPSGKPKPGQPYTGPKGGTGVVGDDGKVRYGVNLSTVPEPSEGSPRYGKREKQIHAAIALAMCEAALRKKMGAAEGDEDELLRWLPELTDPAEAGAALGAKLLGWVEHGTSSSGKPRWRNEETGQLRYQKSKPGEHTERRKQMQGNAKAGADITSKVMFGTHTKEELQALEGHFDSMTVPQLRNARAKLQASFGNARQRDLMVEALKRHVQGRLLEADEPPAPEEPAAPRKLTGAAAQQAKRSDGTPANPVKENVYTVHPSALKVDPERFQYKVSGIGEKGITGELKGTDTYNPELGGTLLAWRDPANGEDHVVNGHHRKELADRTGANAVNVRYIDAPNAKEARARGALANIAEGRGTATDAAKYLRDSGQDIDHLKKAGISLTGKVAADAAHLKDLSEGAFQRLTTGQLDEGKATTVAKHLKDPALQDKLFALMERRADEGKDWGPREVETAAKKMARAGRVQTSGTDLFGDWEDEESTFPEETELEAHIGSTLNRAVNDYKAVSNTGRADRVKDAGNTLVVAENKKRQQQAAQHAADFEREAGLKSPISAAIRTAAAELKKAKPNERNAIKARTLETVRGLLSGSQPVPADAGGSGAGGGGASGDDVPKPTPTPAPTTAVTPEPKRSALARSTDEVSGPALDHHDPASWEALGKAGARPKLLEAAVRLGLGEQAKRLPAAKIVALLQAHQGK